MGKAKDGSECFTRTNNAGGKYTTCTGTQKSKAKSKLPQSFKSPKKRPIKEDEVRPIDKKVPKISSYRQAELDGKLKNFSEKQKKTFKLNGYVGQANAERARLEEEVSRLSKGDNYTPKRIAEYNEALGKAVAVAGRVSKNGYYNIIGHELYLESGKMKYFPNPRNKKT